MPKTKSRLSTTPKIFKMPRQGSEDFFRARHDVDTLQAAEEIKSDPKRLRMAKGVAQRQAKQLKKISK